MIKQSPLLSLIAALTFIFIFGCSGSGNNPTMPLSDPSIPGQDLTSGSDLSNTGDESAQSADESASGTDYKMLWGYYEVAIDTGSWTAEIVPLRIPEYTLNITGFLQPPYGNSNNFGCSFHDYSEFLSKGLIDVDLSVTHPFPGDPTLRAFDLMVAIMGDGSVGGYQDSSVTYPASDGSDLILLNADGYTRWMNATEFPEWGLIGFTEGSKGIPGFEPDATINGYKWYSKNLGVTEDIASFCTNFSNVALRGTFPPGSTLTRRFELQFPMSVPGTPEIKYQYAVIVSWAPATPPVPPIPSIGDFPPEANLQEAFHMDISDNGSDLYYISPSENGGNLRLRIEVFDWQGVGSAGGVLDELSNLNIEDATGNVIPGGYVDVLPSASNSNGCLNSVILEAVIPGCTPMSSGPQEFFLTAISASPTDYDNGFGTPYPTSAQLASYGRVSVNVGNINPCPQPTISGLQQNIVNTGDVIPGFAISGTDFQSGTKLEAEFQRSSGDITGTNTTVISSTSATSDFDFTGATAGMYDFQFVSGCGTAASIVTLALEVNTPPSSSGITGPSWGDGNTGMVTYHANAFDTDTDPTDILTFTWVVKYTLSGTIVVGPVSGDPFSFNISSLGIGNYTVECVVSDGYTPADITLTYPITRTNTQPMIGTPTGQTPVWLTDTKVYHVAAGDTDPGQILTYMWSFVPQATPPSYTIPGDPIPGNVTLNFKLLAGTAGVYDLSCQVDDGSGAPNAQAQSGVLSIYVANAPYTDPIPQFKFNQVITPGWPSLQGIFGCPNYWDTFYTGVIGMVPFTHPDISVLSGPSLGTPGVMVIADEIGMFTAAAPPNTMGFAHFTCPYASGNAPSWSWTTTGIWSGGGPDLIPSINHFDGNAQGELFTSSSMMTGKWWPMANDGSVFSHYVVGGGPQLNDLYTSKVHFLQFPSMGMQPLWTPVDMPGSVGVVAQLPIGLVGPGPGLFNVFPGGPSPAGPMMWPDPYYALAIDDDPSDNPFTSGLPQPVGKWTIAAAIDSDRDVEFYEIDFGAPAPGPAPIVPLTTIPFGSFLGGMPGTYALDCEFISNFSGFMGTLKPVYQEDLLAVLLTNPGAGSICVEIYSLAGRVPTSIAVSMMIPIPPTVYGVPGIAYRLDVDEVTGDIYVLHMDAAGTASIAVTMITY
ncbi:MAG: hypothetical protein NTY09_13335 [bacterium]|nr:hypothetical protein [bacterium]